MSAGDQDPVGAAGEDTPWRRGRFGRRPGPPELLFGRMHEDWRIEAAVFPPGGRVFCIASAGCTVLALAGRGFRVAAADINPAQVEYARSRLAGGPARPGAADRHHALVRRALPLFGLRRQALRSFLALADPAEQERRWREMETRRLRAVLRYALHPLALSAFYRGAFLEALPPRFDLTLLGRLRRTVGTHPNRDNPYLRRLLLGDETAEGDTAPPAGAAGIEIACADAAGYLEGCPPASFEGFTLSNVLDGAPPAYRERLLAAVRRTAAPGAVAVLRSFAEPASAAEAAWARRDRSPLWGGIAVVPVAPGEAAGGR